MPSPRLLCVVPEGVSPVAEILTLDAAGGLRVQAIPRVDGTDEACVTRLSIQRRGGADLPSLEMKTDRTHLIHGLPPGSYEILATDEDGGRRRVLETVEAGSERQVHFDFGQ